MVCLGNICRSPMAEGILRTSAVAAKTNLEIDSAGTGNYHIGENPDSRAVDCMKKHGHDISKLQARQFQTSDFDTFDLIFAMDQSNYNNIVLKARNEDDKMKVKLILSELEDSKTKEVPDPYFGGQEGFEHVYTLLQAACDRFLKRI
jgi:protein-tyrosine phosphatase